MNRHALDVLEFPRVLAVVADRASSALGAARVRALVPETSHPVLESEHRRVSAMRALLTAEGGWSPEPIPALGEPLARLRIEGTTWSGTELLSGALLLRSARRTREGLTDGRRPAMAVAVLRELAERLVSAKPAEAAVERVIADDATVRDDASPTLRRVRRDLRGAEAELVRLLERLMARLEPHHQVSDMSVTVRNGRYVIPIRREGRVVVGGIVHDTSSTGATIFIEPPAAIEAGNRIRELEAEEQHEVERILREATDALRPLHGALVDSLDALTALDSLYARARFALEFRCSSPPLAAPGEGFNVIDARHPLLMAQGVAVVPFDLEMLPDEHTLLVSGPNTGGKTVLLKALALISLLVQSGVPAPVSGESRVAVFDDVFADVGDEQSIQASLSTFSAHLKNQAEILGLATHASLVLMDEVGSGTDPLEGAALGGAILEELTRRGTTTIATTHLGALKELATEVRGVVNASLQFDAVQLAPTYRLIKGVPGRSYGISIARRLALPTAVLERAEERVPKSERDVERLIADLERREAELQDEERTARAVLEDARAKAQRLVEREQRVRDREREVERQARQEARKYLLDARKELERTIQSLREAGAGAVDEQAREARRRVELLADQQGEQLGRLEREERNVVTRRTAPRGAAPAAPAELRAGDVVEVGTLGGKLGRVLERRNGQAVVAVGGIKLTVPVKQLARTNKEIARDPAVPIYGDLPDVHAPSEVDVRGMRVGEVDDLVMQALDSAVRADLKAIRIIHGKGTGALRERVAEMLRKDTRVAGFRLGAWNEGGDGVTVAEIA
jgi:DNA mismatch repair protein MutS2